MDSLDKAAVMDREGDAPGAAEDDAPKVTDKTATKAVEEEHKQTGRTGAKKKSSVRPSKPRKVKPKKSKKQIPAQDESSESSTTDSATSSSGSDSSDSESATERPSRRKTHSKKHAVAKKSKQQKAKKRTSFASRHATVAQSEAQDDSSSEDDELASTQNIAKQIQLLQDQIQQLSQDLRNDDLDQPPPDKFWGSGTGQSSAGNAARAKILAAREPRRSSLASGRRQSDPNAGLGPPDDGGRTQNKKQAAPQKQAKPVEFRRVDEVWDPEKHAFTLQNTAEPAPAVPDHFPLQVRRVFDYHGRYKATYVDIKSEPLRECLQAVIGNIRGISLVEGTPKLDPNTLFLYLEDLRTYLKELKKTEPSSSSKGKRKKERAHVKSKRRDLKVLIKYLDTDYADTKKSLYPMLENGLITFDLLWALYKPGTIAYTTTYGSHDDPRATKVVTAEKHHNPMKDQYYFLVEGTYLEYDGKEFGYGRIMDKVDEFRGARKVTSLDCYPLKYHKNEAKLREDLVLRGKKFVALTGMQYEAFNGMAYSKSKKGIMKYNINGRIMVDPKNHRRVNPNYSVSNVRPKDQEGAWVSDDEDSADDTADAGDGSESDQEGGFGGNGENVKYVTKAFRDEKGKIKLLLVPQSGEEEESDAGLDQVADEDETSEPADADDDSSLPDDKTVPKFRDEDYLIASSLVLGFALGEKLWLEFAVSGVKEIQWNDDAYESLVLQAETKNIVKALVESHKYHASESIDDVIQGKGKGLVAVLHGPPGTGKTLTAEGISELLKCPLYVASAGELSTSSKYLEAELQKILDICHAWGAILLIDEADVFLEKRNMQDVHRNALVSVFLRQLEYFQGILFLTTNRVETFDDAFQSRIHIALRYDGLDQKAKKTIFKLFIERVRVMEKIDLMPFSEEDFNTLARHDLNGRQIKNTVRTAQALAVNKGEPLSMHHIKQVIEVQTSFDRDLKGGTGYQDAMRSYF